MSKSRVSICNGCKSETNVVVIEINKIPVAELCVKCTRSLINNLQSTIDSVINE